ncbi:MAG TPA: DUF885 domain-containing protein [Steroidobacteraceae bacterium]|jgi:uncharacterized protein DUF885|nr:DUF885 domain-containing protein [Steroidobacteraceae bacterium]
MFRAAVLIVALVAPAAFAAQPSWIEESNRHAQILLDVMARYNAETAASLGVEGHDSEIFDLKPRFSERQEADLGGAIAKLEQLRGSATDPLVRRDLDVLIGAARDQKHSTELGRQLALPFFDLGQAVFRGFQDLLDPRIAKTRQKAVLSRLHRYVGAEKGYEPVTALARARYEEQAANAQLIGPWIVEAQQYLDNQPRYLDGIQKLLEGSGLKGWQKDLQTLRAQFDEYGKWVTATVLPRARKTNQLPAELYADSLKRFGVQMDPHEIMARALASYQQSRSELEPLARRIAEERKWPKTDYRDVIRELKKQRIADDKLLALYTGRLEQIEAIIRRENFVTLPNRKAVIRLATAAESAATPAPHIDPPRLIGNTGEPAEFVLPTSNPNAAPGSVMDDFNYDAIAWTLTAHEARPGHELQFANMLEQGVSTARVVFALNSANVEGWALYAEAELKQYLPPEGQVGALQMRMMREARAFLDPMLNLGLIEPAAAKRFLMEEVMLSEPMAKQEVDRYTFQAPGQATAYFYGYSRLNALRTRLELALAGRFDRHRYHDFIVAQGPLPFDLLEQAVEEEFLGKPRS